MHMRFTCVHHMRMGMIQIRNVPDDLHRRLKAKAALEGISLSELLLREATAVAETPTLEELRARLAALPPVASDVSAAELVRADRDSH